MSTRVKSRFRISGFVAALLVSVFLPRQGWADGARPDATTLPAAPKLRERVAFAVVIGNNKSLGRRRPELRYADDDAARYFEILQAMAPGRVSLLADFDRDSERLFPAARANSKPPNRANLAAIGRKLAVDVAAARAAGHETEVYFVFAGHGDVAEGEGFIELSDARFRAKELETWLRGIPFSRGHLILDSCNSFFMLGVRKPGGRHFATPDDAAHALAARLPNVGVFLSTSAEGEAFEWSEIQSGIFSHVLRSGLLGGADENGDGAVSYLELAAFVDTATADVKNPSMRPYVFARGPGAAQHTPIARLHSMSSVRRFELAAAEPLRVRLRDENGLPLLDAHTEKGRSLVLSIPETWARGAIVERTETGLGAALPKKRTSYAVPEAPGTVTLAALQGVNAESAVRGPGDSFQLLFAQPFGPRALSQYLARSANRPRVFGVSSEDVQRMDLVLDEIARAERGRRMGEGVGAIGFGLLLGGAGIGLLHVDSDFTKQEKTEARVLGGVMLGLGTLFTAGGTAAMFIPTTGEEAAAEFRLIIGNGGDPARAFAAADERLQKLAKRRRAERYAGGFFGGLFVLASTTGLIWTEIAADENDKRMAPRLGWSAGIVGGALMIGDAALTQTPMDSLTKIWRDDPSLHQYQPSVSITRDGAFFGLSGTL
jgi:hypothetical protein